RRGGRARRTSPRPSGSHRGRPVGRRSREPRTSRRGRRPPWGRSTRTGPGRAHHASGGPRVHPDVLAVHVCLLAAQPSRPRPYRGEEVAGDRGPWDDVALLVEAALDLAERAWVIEEALGDPAVELLNKFAGLSGRRLSLGLRPGWRGLRGR